MLWLLLVLEKTLRPEIRQKLAWTLSEFKVVVSRRAAHMEQEARSSGINAISLTTLETLTHNDKRNRLAMKPLQIVYGKS